MSFDDSAGDPWSAGLQLHCHHGRALPPTTPRPWTGAVEEIAQQPYRDEPSLWAPTANRVSSEPDAVAGWAVAWPVFGRRRGSRGAGPPAGPSTRSWEIRGREATLHTESYT